MTVVNDNVNPQGHYVLKQELEQVVAELKHEIEHIYMSLDEVTKKYADAIIAMQTKIGIDHSGDPRSLDYKVSHLQAQVSKSNE